MHQDSLPRGTTPVVGETRILEKRLQKVKEQMKNYSDQLVQQLVHT